MGIGNLNEKDLVRLAVFLDENKRYLDLLVEKLIDCRALSKKNTRAKIINRLQVKGDIDDNDVPKYAITSIVTTVCYYPEHFPVFLEVACVEDGYKDSEGQLHLSNRMEKVVNFLNQLLTQLPTQPMFETRTEQQLPIQPLQRPQQIRDPICNIGREYHWDRETTVNEFVDMVKGNPVEGKVHRVLAIQSSPKTGLQNSSADSDEATLVRRLQMICKELPFPVLYTRFRFTRFQQPIDIIKEILRGFKDTLRCTETIVSLQQNACMIVDQTLDRIAPKKDELLKIPLTPRGLAAELCNCISQLAPQFRVVILIQNFEELPDTTQNWFINDLLIEYLCTIEKLTLVVTGYEGLQDLNNRKDTIHCILSLPEISADEFYWWATEGWHLNELTKEDAEYWRAETGGNPMELWKVIKQMLWHAGRPLPVVR